MAATGKINSILQSIEATIAAVPAQRAAIDRNFGKETSPVRSAALRNLREDAEKAVGGLRFALTEAFDAAKAEARQMKADAARKFGQSAEGGRYHTALAGFGAIATRMTAQQVADRLDAAVDAGLIGEIRAWADLARLHQPVRTWGGQGEVEGTAPLHRALLRAEAVAFTPAEQAADAEAAYLEVVSQRAGLFAGQLPSRLRQVLDGYEDHGADNLLPANVFVASGEQQAAQFNSQIAGHLPPAPASGGGADADLAPFLRDLPIEGE